MNACRCPHVIGASEEIHARGTDRSDADAADPKRIASILEVQRAAAIAKNELSSGDCYAHRTSRRV